MLQILVQQKRFCLILCKRLRLFVQWFFNFVLFICAFCRRNVIWCLAIIKQKTDFVVKIRGKTSVKNEVG